MNSWNFYIFSNCSILKICYCSQLNNFRNLMFWKLKNLGNLSYFRKCRFFEFATLQIFGIFNIEFFEIFNIEFLFNFQNYKFLEIPKLNFFEFAKLQIFEIVRIGKLRNLKKFVIRKIKVCLQKMAILELFVHSIFRTTRNFANSQICSLI